MDIQIRLQMFLVFFVLTIAGQTSRANAENLDKDQDALNQFKEIISGLAHSIEETSNALKGGITDEGKDVEELKNSESRMTFEVQVMRLEQDAEVLSGKRTANSAEKERHISDAEKNLTETLTPKIQEVAQELEDLNSTVCNTTLKDKDLEKLIKKANANLTEEDQIVIPTSGEVMGNVTAEIKKVASIFKRLATPEQMKIIQKQLTTIKESFDEILIKDGGEDDGNDDDNESQESNLENVVSLCAKIDTSLAQIWQLNVLDSQPRMEL